MCVVITDNKKKLYENLEGEVKYFGREKWTKVKPRLLK